MRRCVICAEPLPAGRLMTCGPACAKVAREQEAKRLRDAQAAYLARSTDALAANRRNAPMPARDASCNPRWLRQQLPEQVENEASA